MVKNHLNLIANFNKNYFTMIKKFTFLLLFVGAYLSSFAQTPIFFEDFEGSSSLPAGWAVYDLDGKTPQNAFITDGWVIGDFLGTGNNAAWSTSYYAPAGQSDDWLVTPLISLPNSPNVVLTFDVYPIDPNFPDNYEVWISTVGNEPADFDDKIFEDTNPIGGVVTNEAVSLADYAGQDVYIAFRNVANDEFFLTLDNITVKEIPSVDLEVASIDMSDYIAAGLQDVVATVSNQGGNAITSFDLTWTVGDAEYTSTISGVDIETFETYQVTHEDQWDASAGEFTLTVSISNVNGEGGDENVDNDSMEKELIIASNSVQRKPLFEEFTSSTCGPCYTFNTQLYNPWFNLKNYDDHSLVKYQVNWPGAGDPYYTAEVGQRRLYYDVDAAPTMLLEGAKTGYLSMQEMEDGYQAEYANPAFFDMEIEASKSGKKINVEVTTTPFVNGDFVVYIAVVEKTTTGNIKNNGETEFHHVMMKMLPNAEGELVSFVDGEAHTISYEDYDLSNTNVEDFNDLHVVAWVQDPVSKKVMQSENTANNEALGLEVIKKGDFAMYPNPAENVLNISTVNEVDITISDFLGQTVVSQSAVNNGGQIDISNLASGIYFVNFTQNSSTITKKLIVK